MRSFFESHISFFENDSQKQSGSMKLSEAGRGSFRLLRADLQENRHALRLCELGLVPGAAVTLVRESRRGNPLVVQIDTLVLCVEESLAHLFFVEPIETTL